jgi:hypothetical protein
MILHRLLNFSEFAIHFYYRQFATSVFIGRILANKKWGEKKSAGESNGINVNGDST